MLKKSKMISIHVLANMPNSHKKEYVDKMISKISADDKKNRLNLNKYLINWDNMIKYN